ncbi:hypothetical protein LP7551_04953 [Roseibium album]|nr:hypothetical protein LP7551_04953 [Roseibium album]
MRPLLLYVVIPAKAGIQNPQALEPFSKKLRHTGSRISAALRPG